VGHYTAAGRQFHVRTEMPVRRVQRNVGVRNYGPVCTPVETARRATQLPILVTTGGTHNLEVKAITRSDWIMTSAYVLQ
jgi:hypothetical protein